MNENVLTKLKILAESAKYDVSCASSGTSRKNKSGGIGSAAGWGICHSFAEDGRCISLLKIMLTNYCMFDCAYCINRRSNDIPRATLTVTELVNLTIEFYRRNYIEGLFLSSGVVRNPDYTMERLVRVAKDLRQVYRFNGYIHLKSIPGASRELVNEAGLYADRLSVSEGLRARDVDRQELRRALAIVGDVNSISVAEQAMMLLMAAAKRAIRGDRAVRAGDWGWRNRLEQGELRGKRLLVVGYGRSGRHLARMASGFGMEIRAFDPFLERQGWPEGAVAPVADLAGGLGWADLVSVHAPKADQPVIGAAEFAAMKPSGSTTGSAAGSGSRSTRATPTSSVGSPSPPHDSASSSSPRAGSWVAMPSAY